MQQLQQQQLLQFASAGATAAVGPGLKIAEQIAQHQGRQMAELNATLRALIKQNSRHGMSVKEIFKALPKPMEKKTQLIVKEVRTRFAQLQSAREVVEKMERQHIEGRLPPQLSSLPVFQYPKFYLQAAAPVAHIIDEDFAMDSDGYDLEKRLQTVFRQRRQEEAEWMMLHAKASLEHAKERTTKVALLNFAEDQAAQYLESLLTSHSQSEIEDKKLYMAGLLGNLVDQLREQHGAALESKAKLEKDRKEKRRQEQANAEAAMNRLPANALLSLALLEGKASGSVRGVGQILQKTLEPFENDLAALGLDKHGRPKDRPSQGQKTQQNSRQSSKSRGRSTSTTRSALRSPSGGRMRGPRKGRGKGQGQRLGKGRGKSQERRMSVSVSAQSRRSQHPSRASSRASSRSKGRKGGGKGKGKSKGKYKNQGKR